MQNLLDYNLIEIKEIFSDMGQPSFRATQLYNWINNGVKFNDMTDIPLKLRQLLAINFTDQTITIKQQIVSSDKSIKFLYSLNDGNIIEGVFMPHSYGNTICVSTQVGCRMGCDFCASGLDGLIRNLTCGEILGQVVAVNKLLGGNIKIRKITNVVLMGSGEPLDNYDNTVKFLKLINNEQGLNISQRNISLSTCGLADKIKQLADDGFSVTLSLSLHSTNDESRKKVMPIANKYKLNEVIDAAKYYFNKTGRRVIFEYAMIKGVNMDFFDAKRLCELTKGFSVHVNLIKLNYVKEKNIQGCTDSEAERFKDKLEEMGVSATIRKSFGSDIGGACGQLRQSYLK